MKRRSSGKLRPQSRDFGKGIFGWWWWYSPIKLHPTPKRNEVLGNAPRLTSFWAAVLLTGASLFNCRHPPNSDRRNLGLNGPNISRISKIRLSIKECWKSAEQRRRRRVLSLSKPRSKAESNSFEMAQRGTVSGAFQNRFEKNLC